MNLERKVGRKMNLERKVGRKIYESKMTLFFGNAPVCLLIYEDRGFRSGTTYIAHRHTSTFCKNIGNAISRKSFASKTVFHAKVRSANFSVKWIYWVSHHHLT